MTKSILRKSPNTGAFVSDLKENETLSVNGPATFKLLQCNSDGHRYLSKVAVIADKSVKIWKNFGDNGKT